MDGEYKEGWDWTEYATLLREETIAWKVDKAVRERRVWLAAAAEPREAEEVKRTGPASPAPCLQGLRWGETGRIQEARTVQGSTQEDRERSDLSHLWGAYRSHGVVIGGAAAGGFAMGVTSKANRRTRRQGASTECWLCGLRGCDCEASEDKSVQQGSRKMRATRVLDALERAVNRNRLYEAIVAWDVAVNGLAVVTRLRREAEAEQRMKQENGKMWATRVLGNKLLWLAYAVYGNRLYELEAIVTWTDMMWSEQERRAEAEQSVQHESRCSAPVTPEQRTISMEQVTPERTGVAEGEFSLGPAAVEERGERTREVGTQMQTAEGPTADRERTGMTDADEIQELKVCVEELQAQVLGAGRLAAMVADWTVASPGATVREIQRKDTQCRGAGRLKAQRARDKADRLTAIARKATADANAAEAAAEMRDRAAEMAAVRREEHVQKRAGRTKKATATTIVDRTTVTTGTMDTPVEERRAAMKGISTQFTQYSEEQNNTVTAIEMEKYRTKNRPWD